MEVLTAVLPTQTLAELGFFYAIVSGVSRMAPGHEIAAAEAFYTVATDLMHALMTRLSALSQAPPSSGAPAFFSLLATTKEVCTRSKELAQLCFTRDLSTRIVTQLSGMWDTVTVTFQMSNKMAAYVRALSPTLVARNGQVRCSLPLCSIGTSP